MHFVLLISAERGRRCLESLYERITEDDQITIFTFIEKPWEPKYVDDISRLAKLNNSNIYITSKVHEQAFSDFWKREIDVIIAIGWRYLLPSKIYKTAKKGCYVFHDSCLPEYRGFSPTVWAIREGEKYTGISVFKITKKVDEGPILFQEKVSIDNDDYISDVMQKVTERCEKLIKKLYDFIVIDNLTFTEQNHLKATYFSKLKPDDFKIDWHKNSQKIFNLIRSYSYPYPGSFTYFEMKKLYIYSSSIDEMPVTNECTPGTVININDDKTITVMCGDSTALRLKEVSLNSEVIIKPKLLIQSIGVRLG